MGSPAIVVRRLSKRTPPVSSFFSSSGSPCFSSFDLLLGERKASAWDANSLASAFHFRNSYEVGVGVVGAGD